MYQDADRRALLARRLKHDKVLDFILTKANVTDVPKDVPKHENSETRERTINEVSRVDRFCAEKLDSDCC